MTTITNGTGRCHFISSSLVAQKKIVLFVGLLVLVNFWTLSGSFIQWKSNSGSAVKESSSHDHDSSSSSSPPPPPFRISDHDAMALLTSGASNLNQNRITGKPLSVSDLRGFKMYFINNTLGTMTQRTNKPFLFCMAPKSGATTWKAFFLYVNARILIDPKTIRANPGAIHSLWGSQEIMKQYDTRYMEEKILSQLLMSSTDRFVVGRNPYVRFLSSYQDWLRRTKMNASFAEFAHMIHRGELPKRRGTLRDHIDPISKFCRVSKIPYTSILRVEQQPLWFDTFLRQYAGMKHLMKNYTASGNLLFQHTLSGESKIQDYISSIVGRASWPGAQIMNSSHHRNSINKVFEYYVSRELVDVVTSIVMEDLKVFSYPLWNGDPATFRLV